MKTLIIFISICINISFIIAQDGSLDYSFDYDGRKNVEINFMQNDYAHAVAVQSDGKIIVTGEFYTGTEYDIAIIRLNTNGTLDNTFGYSGYLTIDIQNDDFANAILLQNDGKILIVGMTKMGTWIQDFCLIRLNSNGTLDNTFGTSGIVVTNAGSIYESANAIAVQSDGKILVSGYLSTGSYTDLVVARYNSDGTLDNTFGSGGIVTTAIGSQNDESYSVAIQSDGKIIAGGYSSNGSNYDFALVRYKSDGSLDTGFDSDGKQTTSLTSLNDMGYSLVLQDDGKIILSGTVEVTSGSYDFASVRYNSDGTVDNTFGSSGKVIQNIMTVNDFCYSSALQADGKIILAGYSSTDFALLRLDSNGSIDYSFDYDGKVLTAFGSDHSKRNSVAFNSDASKIVLVGSAFGTSSYDFGIAVYTNTAPLPVELIQFTASVNVNKTLLHWETTTEVNNYGFEIERAIENGKLQIDNWEKIGFVAGHGNSNSPKEYLFVDENPKSGKNIYRLKQIDFDGKYEYSQEIEVDIKFPTEFSLSQNYPNPFNPITTIKYSIRSLAEGIAVPLQVTLKVYDILGREVTTLVNEKQSPGNYEVQFDASEIANGVYIYKLQSGNYSAKRKLIYIK